MPYNTGAGGTEKPNILIIMTDQHRHDLMSCAGRDEVPTPNLDKIASAGVRFENAYCPYPVCMASRSSLLTGLYAHRTGAVNNHDRLDWRFRTMAHHFNSYGYLTGLIGKMHFNDACKHGFAYYMSINDWLMYLGPKVQYYADEIANHPLAPIFFKTIQDDGAGFPDMGGLWDNGSPWVGRVNRYDFKSMASKLEADDHLDMFVARESVKFMERFNGQPFFLMASFMKPHTPFYPPKKYTERYPAGAMVLPPIGDISQYPGNTRKKIENFQSCGDEMLKAARAGYYGNLAFVDDCIGYLYAGLEKLGLLENTLVVYTSDHGEMDGDHGLYQKFCLYEPSVKVPLIISRPGHLPAGKVSHALIEQIGLFPTVAALSGTPVEETTVVADFPGAPPRMDGKSFADIVANPSTPGPEAVFSEYNIKARYSQYMVRTRRHKYICNQDLADELYDMEKDPGENANLIGESGMQTVIDEMKKRLKDWYAIEKNPLRDCRNTWLI